MNDVSTASKIVDQCRAENTDPFNMYFSSGGCSFTIDQDDIKNYFIEYGVGKFNQII